MKHHKENSLRILPILVSGVGASGVEGDCFFAWEIIRHIAQGCSPSNVIFKPSWTPSVWEYVTTIFIHATHCSRPKGPPQRWMQPVKTSRNWRKRFRKKTGWTADYGLGRAIATIITHARWSGCALFREPVWAVRAFAADPVSWDSLDFWTKEGWNKPFRYFASKASTTTIVNVEENLLLGVQNFQQNNFRGKIFFLINGLSFSTTADFCAIAKSNNRGIFIGEETGGGYYGNTSGGAVNVKLPGSNIDINIPQFKYVNDVKKAKYKDRGIIPDYTIVPTIDDVLQQKDVQLNYALKLTKEK